VRKLLIGLGFSRQLNRKADEGSKHPDRNAQFEHINAKVVAAQAAGQPVVSVDTKKKELVGEFKNGGREWHPKGTPEEVRVHDFAIPELGRVSPYGVDDLAANAGWVSVGIDHDTAEFAVQSIRRWWLEMGRPLYTRAKRLLITADCGGSNGYRVRLWRLQLQHLADELRLTVQVCHFPPGTSKWNKIEHRMFCHITNNWRGRPLLTRQIVVNLIGGLPGTSCPLRLTRSACVHRAVAARRWSVRTPHCCGTWMRWWSQPRGATPCRRCAGRARARRVWRSN